MLPVLNPFANIAHCLQNHGTSVQSCVQVYGILEDILNDRGVQFMSRVWFNFMEKLGVSETLTSGYHPQFNGWVGWANQKVGGFLRVFCSENQGDCIVSPVGKICPKFPVSFCHTPYILSVHASIPAAPVPMEHQPNTIDD